MDPRSDCAARGALGMIPAKTVLPICVLLATATTSSSDVGARCLVVPLPEDALVHLARYSYISASSGQGAHYRPGADEALRKRPPSVPLPHGLSLHPLLLASLDVAQLTGWWHLRLPRSSLTGNTAPPQCFSLNRVTFYEFFALRRHWLPVAPGEGGPITR